MCNEHYYNSFSETSGFLLTYLTLKHLSKADGKINWAVFYLHRFVRITPAYMVALAIWASLAIHFGQGPGKISFFEGVADICKERWWTHPLYINNLYPFPGDLTAVRVATKICGAQNDNVVRAIHQIRVPRRY